MPPPFIFFNPRLFARILLVVGLPSLAPDRSGKDCSEYDPTRAALKQSRFCF